MGADQGGIAGLDVSERVLEHGPAALGGGLMPQPFKVCDWHHPSGQGFASGDLVRVEKYAVEHIVGDFRGEGASIRADGLAQLGAAAMFYVPVADGARLRRRNFLPVASYCSCR